MGPYFRLARSGAAISISYSHATVRDSSSVRWIMGPAGYMLMTRNLVAIVIMMWAVMMKRDPDQMTIMPMKGAEKEAK